MNRTRLFEALDIPPVAGNIYLNLIERGPGHITEVAVRTGLYRPLIYKNLYFLIAQNLVTKIKKGKRWIYIAEPPKRLESTLEQLNASASQFITDLTEKYSRKHSGLSVSYHEGKEGIRRVFDEIMRNLKKGDVMHRYESPVDYKYNARYYPEIYWKKATGQSSEIDKVTITNEKTALKRSKNLSRVTKAIPGDYDAFEYNITELITKDRVAFIDYDAESALIIRDRRFAEFQLKIFKLFFRKL
jgi:sugar-specific transcriptional regulator TrmB